MSSILSYLTRGRGEKDKILYTYRNAEFADIPLGFQIAPSVDAESVTERSLWEPEPVPSLRATRWAAMAAGQVGQRPSSSSQGRVLTLASLLLVAEDGTNPSP